MDEDAVILQMILRRRQAAARFRTTINAMLEITPMLLDDDEEEIELPSHGGSHPGKQPNRPRDFEGSYNKLMQHYFSAQPLYNEEIFRRRFRMGKPLFMKIAEAVQDFDEYFTLRRDALGKSGIRPLVKITAALRMLAYGGAADCNDKYLQLSESTSLQCMDKFCNAIVAIYSAEYLRHPTTADLEQLLTDGAKRGFPGMLGSLDCMHWEWKNCPSGWAGQFQGKEKRPTVILEAVASSDMWIWHAYFGMPGSHNDINVLDTSPLFSNILNGRAPRCEYKINGHHYEQGYYLADGIYPDWAVFVKTMSQPRGAEQKHFVKMQEARRKDVERAFGVLQARFAVVSRPARGWKHHNLKTIMKACIILHNMIVEDERGTYLDYSYDHSPTAIITPVEVLRDGTSISFAEFIDNHESMRNSGSHFQLRNDLIKHQWDIKGRQEDDDVAEF
jgi:hypothetical protein